MSRRSQLERSVKAEHPGRAADAAVAPSQPLGQSDEAGAARRLSKRGRRKAERGAHAADGPGAPNGSRPAGLPGAWPVGPAGGAGLRGGDVRVLWLNQHAHVAEAGLLRLAKLGEM